MIGWIDVYWVIWFIYDWLRCGLKALAYVYFYFDEMLTSLKHFKLSGVTTQQDTATGSLLQMFGWIG